MLRGLITILIPVFFLYPCFPLLLIEHFIVRKISPEAMYRSSHAMVRFVFGLMLKAAGVELEVKGLEKVPEDRPVLYIANHRSYFDIMILYCLAKGNCGVVGKKNLEKIPLLARWMEIVRCLLLDRENLREGMKTILEGIELMKNGTSLLIFPEGTRGKGEDETELLPFHGGSFKLATKSASPVIPVALTGTADIFEKHVPFVRKTKVTVTFCDPIETKGISREEETALPERTKEEILSALKLSLPGKEQPALPAE